MYSLFFFYYDKGGPDGIYIPKRNTHARTRSLSLSLSFEQKKKKKYFPLETRILSAVGFPIFTIRNVFIFLPTEHELFTFGQSKRARPEPAAPIAGPLRNNNTPVVRRLVEVSSPNNINYVNFEPDTVRLLVRIQVRVKQKARTGYTENRRFNVPKTILYNNCRLLRTSRVNNRIPGRIERPLLSNESVRVMLTSANIRPSGRGS